MYSFLEVQPEKQEVSEEKSFIEQGPSHFSPQSVRIFFNVLTRAFLKSTELKSTGLSTVKKKCQHREKKNLDYRASIRRWNHHEPSFSHKFS
jgi:hypothetical protein